MVQSRMRAMIQRRRLRRTLGCAVQIQAAWRGYYVRRRFREEYDRKAQIIIQSRMFESKKVQWYLERERQVMRGKIAVFREWAHSAGKRRALARQRDAAAVAVQRCFRGYLARRERARLHDEKQRGKELGKFVELLRSHMSMVIFEEKERHAVAFPVRGGKGRDDGAAPVRRSPRDAVSNVDRSQPGSRRRGGSVQQGEHSVSPLSRYTLLQLMSAALPDRHRTNVQRCRSLALAATPACLTFVASHAHGMKPQVIVGIPEATAVEKSSAALPVVDEERVGKCKEVPAIPRCLHLRAVVAEVDPVPGLPLVAARHRLATGSLGLLVGGASSHCQKYFQIEAEAELSCGRAS